LTDRAIDRLTDNALALRPNELRILIQGWTGNWMSDTSPSEPRFDEAPESVTRQVVPSDWTHSEIESFPEPPPPRERLFPRKVLIGWALFAVALYFGVRIVGTVIKERVRQTVTSAARESRTKEIIYRTPNGRIIISRNKPNGSITITEGKPEAPPPPATTVTPAAPAAPGAPAPTTPRAKR
jgi:hypothetical protein